jgi:type IV pilus modification protein PilV
MPRAIGLSLIEVLVALLITSVGLLAVTGLQTVALQSNRAAIERAEAVHLADDMFERIRAGFGGSSSGAAAYRIAFRDGAPAAGACLAQTCTYAQLVAFDQASWKCQLGAFRSTTVCRELRREGLVASEALRPGLPGGDGAVDVDADGVVRISIRWQGVDGRMQNVTFTGRP